MCIIVVLCIVSNVFAQDISITMNIKNKVVKQGDIIYCSITCLNKSLSSVYLLKGFPGGQIIVHTADGSSNSIILNSEHFYSLDKNGQHISDISQMPLRMSWTNLNSTDTYTYSFILLTYTNNLREPSEILRKFYPIRRFLRKGGSLADVYVAFVRNQSIVEPGEKYITFRYMNTINYFYGSSDDVLPIIIRDLNNVTTDISQLSKEILDQAWTGHVELSDQHRIVIKPNKKLLRKSDK